MENELDELNELLNDALLAIDVLDGSGMESAVPSYEMRKKELYTLNSEQLRIFVMDMHSVIYQSLSDDDQLDVDDLEDAFNLMESEILEHVSSGKRQQNRLARKTNFALKRSIAIRSKRNRELCKGEFSTWSKKLRKCVYKNKADTLMRKN